MATWGGVRRPYWPALDGIRAVAIALVFVLHLPMPSWRGGFVGVDVFFCLSGFLITTVLCADADRAGRVDLRRFYARRFVRLYPAMLIGLALGGVLVVASRTYGIPTYLRDVLSSVTYTYNLHVVHDHPVSTVAQYWSLAVEEQYYLLWAVAVLLLHRWVGLGRRALRVTGLLLLGVLAVKVAVLLVAPVSASTDAYFLLPGHADELLLGGVLALLVRTGRLSLRSPVLAAGALAGLVLMAWRLSDHPSQHAATVVWLLAASLGGVLVLHVVSAPTSPVARLLGSSPLRWVGRRSYACYCFHYAAINGFVELFGRRIPLVAAAAGVTTLVLAGLSWRFVEEPALAYRRRAREQRPAVTPAPVLPGAQ